MNKIFIAITFAFISFLMPLQDNAFGQGADQSWLESIYLLLFQGDNDPSEVTGLTALAGDTQVVLTWTDPADSDYDHATITWTPADGISQPVNVSDSVETATITGLTNGTPYTFTVKTVNTTSNTSTGVSDSATPADATPPAEVTGLSATTGDTQVVLTWTDPADSDYDHATITWTPADGISQPVNVSDSVETATITGLTNGTPYTFTVKTVDTTSNTSTGVSDSATPFGIKYVFLSSTTFEANLGGYAGADVKCQTLATNAGLPGTYMAWISDNGQTVSDRFTQYSDHKYVLTNGNVVADNWSDLVDGTLAFPINVTETEGAGTSSYAWTNTFPSGSQIYMTPCDNWTTTLVGDPGRAGIVANTDSTWAFDSGTGANCSQSHHIYCFQQ